MSKKENNNGYNDFFQPETSNCKPYILIRDVTQLECDWLERPFKKGDIVYSYTGFTYGCISDTGSAFTLFENKYPFFELPNDAVEQLV